MIKVMNSLPPKEIVNEKKLGRLKERIKVWLQERNNVDKVINTKVNTYTKTKGQN